ncbi:MAG TPA: hypothetical protein VJM11_15070 [Nevskiaceae bacterium]|nr:hypothetical protein [Nevskiaceae bacterium]
MSIKTINAKTASNILGVTGLSRSALRSYLRHTGLFGEQSDLSRSEQAVVARALGQKNLNEPTQISSALRRRLGELAHFTDAAIRGEGEVAVGDWVRAETAGFTKPALTEVLRVVAIVRDVFDLPVPALAEDVSLGEVEANAPVRRAA